MGKPAYLCRRSFQGALPATVQWQEIQLFVVVILVRNLYLIIRKRFRVIYNPGNNLRSSDHRLNHTCYSICGTCDGIRTFKDVFQDAELYSVHTHTHTHTTYSKMLTFCHVSERGDHRLIFSFLIVFSILQLLLGIFTDCYKIRLTNHR